MDGNSSLVKFVVDISGEQHQRPKTLGLFQRSKG